VVGEERWGEFMLYRTRLASSANTQRMIVLWSLTSMLACRMFQLLRSFTGLQEEGGDAPAADHYLYFRGIPNPPDDYLPPTGASPNT